MAKPERKWFPLDVNFTRDDKILAAGERPGWLFLAMLGGIYSNQHHGVITGLEIDTLGVKGPWKPRMDELLRVGLVQRLEPGVFLVPSWEEWQHSTNPQRAEYMRTWRAKKAREALHIAPVEQEEPEP